MWLGLEIELGRRADHAHDFVLLGTSRGDLIEREVRRQQHQLPDSLLGATDLLIDLRNPCAYFPHLDDHLVGLAAIALDPTDLLGDLVSLRLEIIHLSERDPAASVQLQDLVDGIHETLRLPSRDGGLYGVGIASEPPNVKHVTRGLLKEYSGPRCGCHGPSSGVPAR